MADTSTGDISLSPEIEQFLQSAISMGQVKASQQATRDAITEAIGVFKSATPVEMAGVDDYVQAKITENSARALAVAKDDARRAAVRETYSTDPLAAGNAISENAQIMRESLANARDLKSQIDQKRNLTFFESPLEFIASKFELPSLIQRHNQEAYKYNQAEAVTKDAVSLTTAAGGMLTATAEGNALAVANAQNQQLLAQASQQKAQLAISGAKNNVAGFTELSNLTDKAFSQEGIELQRRIEFARFKQWDQEAPDRAQQRVLRNAQLTELLEAKDTKQQAQTALLTAYNFAAARLGVAAIKDPVRLTQMFKPGSSTEQMVSMGQDMMASGQGTATGGVMVTTDNVPIAGTRSDVARLLLEVRAPADVNGPKSLILNTASELATDPVIGEEAKKNPTAFYANVGQKAFDKSVSEMKAISVEKDNIYQSPPIMAIANANPSIRDSTNRFIRENILPMGAANPAGKVDPDVIFGMANNILKSDPSRLNEVVDGITRLFGAAVSTNKVVQQYTNYGLSPQLGYFAQVKTGQMWGTGTFNLEKAVDVKTILLRSGIDTTGIYNNPNRLLGD